MNVRQATIAAEDRRFYSHIGIDLVAVLRASLANAWHRRIVSGASTLTMQLARTLAPHRRSFWGKFTEAALALRIEASLSKDQILEEYLNRVTYGPNLRGYAAASQAYFDVTPEGLSLSQAALIAGLPRGPSLYSVTKRPAIVQKRRDRVLARMFEASMISADARDRATEEPIAPSLDKAQFGAPHFVRALLSGELAQSQPALAESLSELRDLQTIETTIDPDLQRAAEGAVATTLASLTDKHVTAASVVALDNATGDVLAWVGSPDFFESAALGQNDGVLALRQPGSALKPFVYGEAMESLNFTGATLLPDLELHVPLPGGGDYVPHDYDGKLRGPVRLRDALGNSLNIPAIYTITKVGTSPVLERLHAFGFRSLTESAEHYGPALALGDGEVTLLEIANAYSAIARGGLFRPVRFVTRTAHGGDVARTFAPYPATRVMSERVAAMLTDILSDKSARVSAFGDQNVLEFEFDVAAKTGTSKGFRDNVAVGYTREFTVAVWAGNFDGSPMASVSGITGAGPIFRSVMEAAVSRRGAARRPMRDSAAHVGLARTAICGLSGELATSACPHRIYEWLPSDVSRGEPTCTVHERVRIDTRNGLPAGPGCAASVTESRVFERWSPPYDGWAARSHRPLAPDGSSPECPTPSREEATFGSEPRITFPTSGARFAIDPDRPVAFQALEIQVEPALAGLEVLIDGVALPPSHRWSLVAGEHSIIARSGSRTSTPVRFTVREQMRDIR